ncbi:MAG: ATP-binding protein [Chloroflexota bacterium]
MSNQPVTCSSTPAIIKPDRKKNTLRAQRLAQIGFWYWEPSGNYVEWDEIYSEIMGLPAEKMEMTLNQCIASVNQGDQEMIRQILEDVATSESDDIPDMSYRISDKNGNEKYLRVLIDVERDACGQISTVVGTAQDVTGQEKEAKSKLIEAQLGLDKAKEASRAKSDFLANMSHELRTPLNAIIGYSEMVGEELEDGLPEHQAWVTEDIGRITHSARHLLSLINSVLDMSKIESGQMSLDIQSFSIDQLIEDVHQIISPLVCRNNNRFSIDQSDAPDIIIGDKLRIRQVIVNLVNNALKFTQDGVVTLKILSEESDKILFEVHDTGIGIEPELQKEIFSPFKQASTGRNREFDGTGLGLAISKQLTELMQGTIGAESELGVGSVFRVELPLRMSKSANESL